MKYININLTDPTILPIYEKTAGRKGESLTKGVKFALPPEYSEWSAFIETENAEGEKSRDLALSHSDNVVVYEFTKKDLKYKGRLLLDLVLEQGSSIYKPFHGEFAVKSAICATDDINLDGVDIDLTSIALKTDIPTKLSQLKNDRNFITSDDLPPNPIPEITDKDNGGVLQVVEGKWEIQKIDTIQGSDGKDGEDGVGIASVSLNADYTLTILMTDNTSYTTPSIRGEKGEDGKQGQPGHTPEIGIDYFTDEDKTLFIARVKDEMPEWTKSEDKPKYNASEIIHGETNVGNVIDEVGVYINRQIESVKEDIKNINIPTKVGDLVNDVQYVRLKDLPEVKDGKDGYSPVVVVTKTNDGHEVSITDAYSKKTFVVSDGADGRDGANGENGQDGQSATHEWDGTVLTITSASGTTSADLKGEKGNSGVYIGDGDMPEDCNIQINPNGVATDVLPSVTSDNNGSFLRVVDGRWEVLPIDFVGIDSGALDYITQTVIDRIPEWTGGEY